jgi:polyhydroxyalkanoate synthase
MYVLATERDHVSPWRSVYKIHLLCNASIDFVLVSGGHNAGVVCEPGHPRRSYRSHPASRAPGGYCGPQAWYEQAKQTEGSWWPHWQQWLSRHSAGEQVAPPFDMARALEPAPGRFVMQH